MSRIVNGREPGWDIDSAYGFEGEEWTEDFIVNLQRGSVEVKRKRIVDEKFYIEYECKRHGNWQPSGIQTTEAMFWCFVLHDTGLAMVVETRLLKSVFDRFFHVEYRRKEETDGSHPTRGLLVEWGAILNEAKQLSRRAEAA